MRQKSFRSALSVALVVVAALALAGSAAADTGYSNLFTLDLRVPPVISSFTASPASITAGQSATLTWASTGGTAASIDNGVGSVATSGSKVVSPVQTTTYTLTVTGAGGSVTQKVTVTVGAATTGQFTSPKADTRVVLGDPIKITWDYTGASGSAKARLYLVSSNGQKTAISVTTLGAGKAGFAWWIAGAPGSGFRLRLEQDGGAFAFDSVTFSIEGPASAQLALRVVEVSALDSSNGPADYSFGALKLRSTMRARTVTPFANGYVRWDWWWPAMPKLSAAQVPEAGSVSLGYLDGATSTQSRDGLEWSTGFSLLFRPKGLGNGTAYFEHAIMPSATTGPGGGYSFFTVTRFPGNGLVDPTKPGIVFVHGVGGEQGYWNFGDGLPEAMTAMGYEVWEVSYPPLESVRKSAFMVQRALERIVSLRSGSKVHVVAHSMGGLVTRSIVEGLAQHPKSGITVGASSSDPIDKIVFLQSPQHGAHSPNGARGESGCLIRLNLAVNVVTGIPDDCGAALDLALGSPTLWELNKSENLGKLARGRSLSIAGTTNIQGWKTDSFLSVGCDESPNTDGSFDDSCVNEASANLNQTETDKTGSTLRSSGHLIGEIAKGHTEITDAPAADTAVIGVAGTIDGFFKGSAASRQISQTQGIPLLKLLNLGTDSPFLFLDDRRLYRNEKSADQDLGSYNYYLWDQGGERMDLRPGSYALVAKKLVRDGRHWTWQVVPLQKTKTVIIEENGQTSMVTFDWATLKPASAARPAGQGGAATAPHTVTVVGRSQGEAAAFGLTVTDPAGKVIAESRNDFGSSAGYGLFDINNDGLDDVLIVIEGAIPGRYTISWAAASSASPTAGLAIDATLDNQTYALAGGVVLYQQPTGSVTLDADFSAPPPVSDLRAATGSGDREVELAWTDPAGSVRRYDLRFSTSPIGDESAFAAATPIDVAANGLSGPHRVTFAMPATATSYSFRMKTISMAGLASGLSNATSAVSGPGGSGLAADKTPPSAPAIAYEGPNRPQPGALSFSWRAQDAESGISAYRYALGTSPNATDVVGWTSAGASTASTVTSPAIVAGRSYVLTVVARNGAGLEGPPGFSSAVMVPDACPADPFEPDDDPTTAAPIVVGSPQTHSLCSGPDYVAFQAEADVEYEVKTYGLEALAQTTLELLDGATLNSLARASTDPTDGVEPRSARLVWKADAVRAVVVAVTSTDGTYGAFRGYTIVVRKLVATDRQPLRLELAGTGAGSVTSSPAGMACTSSCEGSFPQGTRVVLRAKAVSPSAFGGWAGDCAGSLETCEVVMSQARSVKATFVPPGGKLALSQSRVAVNVSWWSQYSGEGGSAVPIPQGDSFGYFYFFTADVPEVFVKVLDFGPDRPYLLFYAGLTDFGYSVTFRNLETGRSVTLRKEAGSFDGGSDTSGLSRGAVRAFLWSRDGSQWAPAGDRGGVQRGAVPALRVLDKEELDDPALEAAGFTPGAVANLAEAAASGELLLSRQRVAVSVAYRNQYSGQSGNATPIPQKDEFGYFYIFTPDVPEVFVKVLDFGSSSPYLLFFGGLTDFEYTVTFRNVITGKSVSYKKEAGTFNGGADTTTLAHGPCTTLTSAPALVAGTPTTSSVALSWTAVSGAPLYRLYRNGVQVYGGAATSFTDTGLAEGTRYCFSARGATDCGDGPASPDLCVTTASSCKPPTTAPTLTATVQSSSAIALSWSAVSGASQYKLYRNGTLIYTGSATSFTDSGLSGSTGYCYKVRGAASCGEGPLTGDVCATTASSAPSEATVFLPGGVPLVMVKIPGGTFQMGSPTSDGWADSDESPQHQVTLTSDYYMGKYEVTQGQWKAVMGNNPSSFSSCGDTCPVEFVSWNDVAGTGGFIENLNAYLTSTGQAGAGKFRLPTEAEWERAARGGATTRFSFGDASGCDGYGACAEAVAYVWWYSDSAGKTHAVGTKTANPYGLYDMHGNVWEWCQDWYGGYESSAQANPTGPASGSSRVARGGSWATGLQIVRSAKRDDYGPSFHFLNVSIGFRLARSL